MFMRSAEPPGDQIHISHRTIVHVRVVLTSMWLSQLQPLSYENCGYMVKQSPNKIRRNNYKRRHKSGFMCTLFRSAGIFSDFLTKVQEELENVLEKVNYSPTHAGKYSTCARTF